MPRIGIHQMVGWDGQIQFPTAKGSRPSRIVTSALAADAVQAWLLATRYAALVSPTTGHEVETAGGTTLAGVRVAAVTITRVRKIRARIDPTTNEPRTYQVDAVWELHA